MVTPRSPSSRPARTAGPRADLKSLSAGGQVAFNADKGDKQGPIVLGAAVSAPATEVAPPPSGNASPAPPEPEEA